MTRFNENEQELIGSCGKADGGSENVRDETTLNNDDGIKNYFSNAVAEANRDCQDSKVINNLVKTTEEFMSSCDNKTVPEQPLAVSTDCNGKPTANRLEAQYRGVSMVCHIDATVLREISVDLVYPESTPPAGMRSNYTFKYEPGTEQKTLGNIYQLLCSRIDEAYGGPDTVPNNRQEPAKEGMDSAVPQSEQPEVNQKKTEPKKKRITAFLIAVVLLIAVVAALVFLIPKNTGLGKHTLIGNWELAYLTVYTDEYGYVDMSIDQYTREYGDVEFSIEFFKDDTCKIHSLANGITADGTMPWQIDEIDKEKEIISTTLNINGVETYSYYNEYLSAFFVFLGNLNDESYSYAALTASDDNPGLGRQEFEYLGLWKVVQVDSSAGTTNPENEYFYVYGDGSWAITDENGLQDSGSWKKLDDGLALVSDIAQDEYTMKTKGDAWVIDGDIVSYNMERLK